jgi:hypothetical protein
LDIKNKILKLPKNINMCILRFKNKIRLGLAQLFRFLVVELTHSDLNIKFDIVATVMTNYFFSATSREFQDLSRLSFLEVLIQIGCTYIYLYG